METTLDTGRTGGIDIGAAALAADFGASDRAVLAYFGNEVFRQSGPLRGRGFAGAVAAAARCTLSQARSSEAIGAAFSTTDMPGTLATAASVVVADLVNQARPIALDVARLFDPEQIADGLPCPIPRLDGELVDCTRTSDFPHLRATETNSTANVRTFGGALALPRERLMSPGATAFVASILAGLAAKVVQLIDRLTAEQLCEASDVHYTTARGNRLTSSALSATSLAAAEALIVAQADATGTPLGLQPRWLVVPPGLLSVAEKLVADAEPDVARRRLAVRTTPWLTHASIAGSSATSWYLLANPAHQPALLLAALGGAVKPLLVVRRMSGNHLGEGFAIAVDVGVARGSYRGAVKATA